MDITPFDRMMVHHTVKTLTTRWPFVPASQDQDYRGTYKPKGVVDSLAFLASAGFPWRQAKVEVGEYYEKAGFPDSALAEYRGLIRDVPFASLPYELAGRAFMALKKPDSAVVMLQDAYAIRPSPFSAYTLGMHSAQEKDYSQAATYLTKAMTLDPSNPEPVYQLSLTYAMLHNLQGAQAAAMRVYQLQPKFPGLAKWMQALGLTK